MKNEMHANTVGNASQAVLKDIYVIKNKINDKVYVGQALDSEQRFLSHCKKKKKEVSLIDYAIQKYGKENFWYEILESQIENYNERERYWIKELNSKTPNGYNIQDGGEEPPRYSGVEHPSSVFSSIEEVEAVKDDLRNTRLSLLEIAKKYNKSKRTILRINQGIHYGKPGETYPIREVPNMNGILTEDVVDEIIETLKHSYRQYKDIAEQYSVKENTIKEINFGLIHHRDNEDYPIRKYKNSGVVRLTYEQVTEIMDLLLNTKYSCNEISKRMNCSLNDVYLVNGGTSKRYSRDGFDYPLRKYSGKKK